MTFVRYSYRMCYIRGFSKNLVSYLCFLDLRKAYDLVSHDLLLNKLAKAGLGRKFLDFVSRMYANTYMRVRIDKSVSRRFK